MAFGLINVNCYVFRSSILNDAAGKTTVLPAIEDDYQPEAPRAIAAEEKNANAYQKLRHQWALHRSEGIRAARAKC